MKIEEEFKKAIDEQSDRCVTVTVKDDETKEMTGRFAVVVVMSDAEEDRVKVQVSLSGFDVSPEHIVRMMECLDDAKKQLGEQLVSSTLGQILEKLG